MRVAKHGNRSISSKCGSADVMEALGVKISLPAAVLATCLEEVGMVFLFAPAMHSAMKYVQPARRELRLRTVFNLLGPLTNPAGATAPSRDSSSSVKARRTRGTAAGGRNDGCHRACQLIMSRSLVVVFQFRRVARTPSARSQSGKVDPMTPLGRRS